MLAGLLVRSGNPKPSCVSIGWLDDGAGLACGLGLGNLKLCADKIRCGRVAP